MSGLYLQRFGLVLLAFILVAGLATSLASARISSHDQNVIFSTTTIGEGDQIDGDLNIFFGDVTCEGGAEIKGDVNSFGGRFTQLDGCTVDGVVNDSFKEPLAGVMPWARVDTPDLFDQNRRILEKIAYNLIPLLVFLVFPMRVRLALDRVVQHPGLSAATGAIALIAVLPIALLLLVSVIGIPLILLEIAALFAGLWIGQGAVAMLVGRRLYELVRPHHTPSPLGAIVFGLLVISAAEVVPGVGWAVTALVWLVGLGAALLAFVRESNVQSFTRPGTTPPPVGGAPMTTR